MTLNTWYKNKKKRTRANRSKNTKQQNIEPKESKECQNKPKQTDPLYTHQTHANLKCNIFIAISRPHWPHTNTSANTETSMGKVKSVSLSDCLTPSPKRWHQTASISPASPGQPLVGDLPTHWQPKPNPSMYTLTSRANKSPQTKQKWEDGLQTNAYTHTFWFPLFFCRSLCLTLPAAQLFFFTTSRCKSSCSFRGSGARTRKTLPSKS